MMQTIAGADSAWARQATRATFFVAGFGVASWAPLVPFLKDRLEIDEAALGQLILCIGAGSLATMPLAGALVERLGCRLVVAGSGLAFCVVLPLIAVLPSFPLVAGALLLFGASLGILDVSMNVHAVVVDRAAPKPIISGIHALYSLGGCLGAVAASALLYGGVPLAISTLTIAAVLAIVLLAVAPGLLRGGTGEPGAPAFAVPHGIVVLIGAVCFVVFLAEGAVLDWGALLLVDVHAVPQALGGVGYAAFAAAMTVGRITGDRVVHAVGGLRVLVGSGLLTAAGFLVVLTAPWGWLAVAGFFLVGLGAANVIPILFAATGRQKRMPANLAIASVTAIGYAGILAGPALLGWIGEAVGLTAAFALLAAAILIVPLTARTVLR